MSTPIEASDAHPPCHATRLIDHTLIKSGALFQELLGFYRSLSDGRRNWALSDLNRLQFRVELICLLSVAMSPALRHGHIPVAARILQLQVFCDMVTHAGRLAFCEAKPFIAITVAGRARWLLLDLGLIQLARFVHLRGSDLSALAPCDAGGSAQVPKRPELRIEQSPIRPHYHPIRQTGQPVAYASGLARDVAL